MDLTFVEIITSELKCFSPWNRTIALLRIDYEIYFSGALHLFGRILALSEHILKERVFSDDISASHSSLFELFLFLSIFHTFPVRRNFCSNYNPPRLSVFRCLPNLCNPLSTLFNLSYLLLFPSSYCYLSEYLHIYRPLHNRCIQDVPKILI